jgi:ribosomal protein S27AE
LTKADVAGLGACPVHRLAQLLIRWHEGRAVAGAQDVAGLIAATEAGGWCVRDVCWPAGIADAPTNRKAMRWQPVQAREVELDDAFASEYVDACPSCGDTFEAPYHRLGECGKCRVRAGERVR